MYNFSLSVYWLPYPKETVLSWSSQESLAKARCEKTMTFLTKQLRIKPLIFYVLSFTGNYFWTENDFPFPKVGYVSSLEGILYMYLIVSCYWSSWILSLVKSKAIRCAQWSTTMGVADSGWFSGCRTDRPNRWTAARGVAVCEWHNPWSPMSLWFSNWLDVLTFVHQFDSLP